MLTSASPLKRPALHAYVTRVGARERSFKTYVIEDDDAEAYVGKRRVVATIRIAADGTITCDAETYAPTADEQRQIAAEVAKNPFPTSISARSLPPELKGVPKRHLCIFHDRTGEYITFVQWRKDGEKPDLPYSCWSDGKWRNIEPDGELPLFGLETIKHKMCVMIHEGAKGARAVREMLEAGPTHPWHEDLKDAAHIGWPGGAERPHQVDWTPIKNLRPNVRVVVVADHDQVGIDAVARISSILRRNMSAIMFDDEVSRRASIWQTRGRDTRAGGAASAIRDQPSMTCWCQPRGLPKPFAPEIRADLPSRCANSLPQTGSASSSLRSSFTAGRPTASAPMPRSTESSALLRRRRHRTPPAAAILIPMRRRHVRASEERRA